MAASEQALLESLWHRFFERIDMGGNNGCWIWKGGFRNGYAVLRHGQAWKQGSHVALYLRDRVWPLKGCEVCHRCDNPACVNPAHVWVGDRRQNAQDAVKKKRDKNGKKTHCKRGHSLADHLTNARGARRCRTCYEQMKQSRRAKV